MPLLSDAEIWGQPNDAARAFDENRFQQWYAGWAQKTGLDKNPDAPEHRYDYRSAYRAGATPSIDPTDGRHHWPSQFKADDHPNRFVAGVDTKTGKPARLLSDEEVWQQTQPMGEMNESGMGGFADESRIAQQAVSGINEFAAGLPAKIADVLLPSVLTHDENRQPTYPVESWAKRTFYPNEPKTPGEQVARRGGQMAGETLGLGGGLTAIGRAATGPAISGAQMLLQALTRPWGGTAGGMATDVAAGGGAGTAMEAYKQAVPDATYDETLAGLAGGAAVAAAPAVASGYSKVAPVRAVGKIAKNIIADIMPEDVAASIPGGRAMKESHQATMREKAMPSVAKEFSGVKEPEMLEGLDEAARLRQEIPGFDPTLGESTGLQSAVATQKALERNASGPDLDALQARKMRSEGAVEGYKSAQAPEIVGQEAISKGAGRVTGKALSAVDERLARASNEAGELTLGLPEANKYESGSRLRDRLMALRGETAERMSQEAQRLGIDENSFVPFQKLQARIKATIPSKFATDLGPTMQKIAGWDTKGGKPTLADVKFLRESLGDDVRAARQAGEFNKARILTSARNQVDEFLDKDWAPGSDYGERWKEFRGIYKKEYIDRFEKGAAQEAKSIGGDNSFRTDNEKVVSEFWGPGRVSDIKQFNVAFKGDPEAMESLRAIVLDDVRKAAVKDGQIDPKALERWQTKHKDVLAEVPDLKTEIAGLYKSANAVSERQAQLRIRRENIENTALAKSGDPEKIVKLSLSDPAQARALSHKLDDNGKRAMRRALWDKALENDSPEAIKTFLDKNQKTLRAFMTDGHLSALNNIQGALKMHARTVAPSGKPTDADPFKAVQEQFGSGLPQIASRVFAVQSGRTGWRYTMVDLLGRAGIATNRQEAGKIMTQAIYDPKFAAELANYVRFPKQKSETAKRLRAYVSEVGLDQAESE